MLNTSEILNALQAVKDIINYDLIPTFDNNVNVPIAEQNILQNYILHLPSISASKALLDAKFLEIETILRTLNVSAPLPQTIQIVTAQRALSINYTNGTTQAIFVTVTTVNSGGEWVFYVDNIPVCKIYESSYEDNTMSAFVPAGSTYKVTGSGSISIWSELR